ncbi:MAG: DUF2662 domain-containing protein [Streptosporangiales bacterium]|nr:DUF2662 domain-containing protein [Streptosporangiales bacterium]
MSVWSRFERRLEGMVEGAFARAFKSELQPVEVARALAREVDDRAAIIGKGRVLVPNDFIVEIGETDHERLSVYSDSLGTELATVVREHADEEGYHLVGPIHVQFRHAEDLKTGVFRVRSGVQAADRPGAAQPAAAAVLAPPLGQDQQAADDDQTRVTPLRPRQQAHLESADGTVIGWVAEGVNVVGRGSDSDIKITDPGISRKHAEIRLSNGECVVTDLGSTNGTVVDGRPVRRASLYDGSRVQFGRTTLTFRVVG